MSKRAYSTILEDITKNAKRLVSLVKGRDAKRARLELEYKPQIEDLTASIRVLHAEKKKHPEHLVHQRKIIAERLGPYFATAWPTLLAYTLRRVKIGWKKDVVAVQLQTTEGEHQFFDSEYTSISLETLSNADDRPTAETLWWYAFTKNAGDSTKAIASFLHCIYCDYQLDDAVEPGAEAVEDSTFEMFLEDAVARAQEMWDYEVLKTMAGKKSNPISIQ